MMPDCFFQIMELLRPIFLLCFLLLREGDYIWNLEMENTVNIKVALYLSNDKAWYNICTAESPDDNIFLVITVISIGISPRWAKKCLNWSDWFVFTKEKCFVNSLPSLQSITRSDVRLINGHLGNIRTSVLERKIFNGFLGIAFNSHLSCSLWRSKAELKPR